MSVTATTDRKSFFSLIVVVLAAIVWAVTANDAQSQQINFDVIEKRIHERWSTVLYRNTANGNRFCSVESHDEGTTFRVVQYLNSKDTFLELFNEQWNLLQGSVRFQLKFQMVDETIEGEFPGKSWGNSITFDIVKREVLSQLMNSVANGRKVWVLDSNSVVLAEYELRGSLEAVKGFVKCIVMGEL